MEMPPLPKPENEAQSDDCTYACPEGWSAEQMRQFGELCARMAREEAAKLCDEMAARWTNEEAVRTNNLPSINRGVGAARCAAAIRSES